MPRLLFLLLVLLAVLAPGCAAHKAYESAPMASWDDAGESDEMSREIAAKVPSGRAYQQATGMSAGVAADMASAPEMEEAPAPSQPASTPAPTPARMVHYEGYARLRVSQLDEAVDAITALATSLGGKIELSTRTRVVARVPVATFREAYPKFLALGDVLDRSMTAQDVTEAFTAVELRLQTAEAARDRLVALLAKSTDEAEKLMLLREIQRLEEEIDQLHDQSATLSDLASMSRITLDLVPRDAVVAQASGQESLAVAWLRGLSPFRDDAWQSGKKLAIEVPEGMVRLDPKRYTAEAADGARIRGCRLDLDPRADGDWWIQAITERLAPEFASAESRHVGEFTVLRLVDRGDDPYVYVVAARVNGAFLELVEVYYPTVATEERHAPAVDRVLGGGAS